jgi:Raf kinase inhibitor-like YbhB/YbcL family protein
MNTMIGRLLRPFRAGERKLLWNDPRLRTSGEALELFSPAFEPGGRLPRRYAGQGVGDNCSPPLRWSEPPAGARELTLALEDPDAPLLSPFVHLLLLGLPARCTELAEGALQRPAIAGRLGVNTFGEPAYAGPRALPGHGPHRCVFELFALSRPLDRQVSTRREFLSAAAGSVLARGRLDVVFERP